MSHIRHKDRPQRVGATVTRQTDTTNAPQEAAGEETGGARPLWWKEAVRLKDTMGLRELADQLGVRVGVLAAELRRAGMARVPAGRTAAPEASLPRVRHGSQDGKIVTHFHLLGNVPDADLARASGVSIRTIASYRARHGIPGYDGPRRRPVVRGRRESRLEDHRDVLGTLPDRVVADLVGMSLGAVRNFRVKHGITAAGRLPQRRVDEALRAIREGNVPAPAAARSERPAPTPAASQVAWRVRLSDGSSARDVVLIAPTMVAALERAQAIGGDGVQAVERLGPVIA